MTTEADDQPGAELVTETACATEYCAADSCATEYCATEYCAADSFDTVEQAAAGRITIAAARRFGARASALAGLVASAGMVGAMTVAEHTTPSVKFL